MIATTDDGSSFPRIAGVIAFLAVAAFLIGPRATPALLPLLAAIPISLYFGKVGRFQDWKFTPLVYVLIAFGVYLVINLTWSVVPAKAAGRVAQYFVYIGLVSFGLGALKLSNRAFVESLGRSILLAATAAAAFLVIEVLFHLPIQKTVLSIFTFLQPSSPKHVTVTDGVVTRIGSNTLNRNVASLCLVLWPALLLANTLLERRKAFAASLLLMVLALVAVLYSDHETSILALGFSALIFVIARQWPKAGMRALLAGWVIATMLVVPIAMIAYAQELHFASAIPSTGRARIILWGYTAEQVLNNPVLGVGVASTKPLDQARAAGAERPKGYVYALRTGRHSHNIYMQVWYELGGIGAICMLVAGLMLILRLARLPRKISPFAMAMFTSAAVTGAFSWGMWQSWFMAAFGLSALIGGIAIEVAERKLGTGTGIGTSTGTS